MPMPTGAALAERAPVLTATAAALLLALLLGLQPVATDLYLPALPLLAADLHAPMSAVQLTMSMTILAFGLAQLVWGPLADRFGRRPVMLAGVGLFALACFGAAMAADIAAVVAWRALQGAGMSAAVVCGRAMLRDLFEPSRGARVMSQALTGLGVVALLSPVIGGAVTAVFGWRATMTTAGLWASIVWGVIALRVPETSRHLDAQATRPGPLLRQLRATLAHPTFRAWAALSASSYGGMFLFLAGSSFVFIGWLKLSPAAYGFTMASLSAAYIAGTVLCRWWLRRLGLRRAVAAAAGLTLAGGLLLVATTLAGWREPWAVMAPMWLYALGHGTHQPCSQAGVVGPFPRAAGVAAASAGFVLAALAFALGLALGATMDGTPRPLALGIGVWALVTALVAWTLVQRHGELPPT